jgi:hypothetical protein
VTYIFCSAVSLLVGWLVHRFWAGGGVLMLGLHLALLASYGGCALQDPGYLTRDQVASIRRCRICKLSVSARTYHCESCNMCVREHDHHCPWVGKCVGAGNLLLFQVFVTLVSLALVTDLMALGAVAYLS